MKMNIVKKQMILLNQRYEYLDKLGYYNLSSKKLSKEAHEMIRSYEIDLHKQLVELNPNDPYLVR